MITKNKIAIATTSAFAAVALPMAALAGFAPDRPTYTCNSAGQCIGANHVQFNSFTNNPNYGDERDFLMIRDASGGTYTNTKQIEAGKEYVVRAYVHNNAQQSLAGANNYIAHNTTFKVGLPAEVNGAADATGYISASNANPGSVSDTITMNSNSKLKLSYVPGSAKWRTNALNDVSLGDSVFSNGALLGYNSLNGEFPGCFEFSGYVSFKVKAEPITTVTEQPKEQPKVTTPAALPETGPEAGLAAAAVTGAMGYAVMAYRRSKQAIAEKLINRK